MTVIVEIENRLDPLMLGGSMERFVHELNLQSAQGKQFLLMQAPDDSPVGLNIRKVLTIRPERPEDAFFSDTASGGGA
jgi:hypothetical protein